MIASEINHARLVMAADQGRVPMKAVTRLAFRRLGAQLPQFAVPQIDAMHFAALAFGVERVAIVRIEHDVVGPRAVDVAREDDDVLHAGVAQEREEIVRRRAERTGCSGL